MLVYQRRDSLSIVTADYDAFKAAERGAASSIPSGGRLATIFSVSKLTVTTLALRRRYGWPQWPDHETGVRTQTLLDSFTPRTLPYSRPHFAYTHRPHGPRHRRDAVGAHRRGYPSS